MAVTFTNKAAKEMQNRVSKILGSTAVGLSWLGTFHSICAKLLRKHASAANLNSNFTIIDTDDQIRLIKNICKAENIDIKQLSPRFILAIIDRWKIRIYPNEVIINKKSNINPIWIMRQAGRYLPEFREIRNKIQILSNFVSMKNYLVRLLYNH